MTTFAVTPGSYGSYDGNSQADPWDYAADSLDPPEHEYAGDVPGWAYDKLGEEMWSAERAICEALREHRYVAVKSCHDVGKSFTASRIVAHWIDTHPRGEAFAVTTAPTDPQVKAILWREIGRAHRKGNLPGRVTLDARWKVSFGIGPDELVGMGRKPADYEPTAFQGIHSRFPIIVIDEAGGVPKAIFDAVDSLATNEYARVLAVGNPDDPSTHFAEICKPGSGWYVMRIDGLTSPNFTRDEINRLEPHLRDVLVRYMIAEGIAPTDEQVSDQLRPMLLSPLWVAERIIRWTPSSPLFVSKVRGEFPDVAIDTLIEPRWVYAAQRRELPEDHTEPRIGVDVARYGMDKSIIILRLGGVVRVVHEIPKGPVTEVAGLVQEVGMGRPLTPVANVDDVGVGGGVTDILVEDGYPVLPMLAGAACSEDEVLPNGKPRFVNARSEWWWTAREALAGPSGTGEDGWIDIDPDDEELASQLLAPKYKVNRHGQIEVESKDDMRKRKLPSPDRADAFVMSLVVQAPATVVYRSESLTGDLMEKEM